MKSPSCQVAEIEMLKRGWTRRELAARCGLTHKSLVAVLGGFCRNRSARARVENAFGAPIWSRGPDWQERRSLAPHLGGRDPVLVGLAEAQDLARRWRVRGRARARKGKLISLLAAHARERAKQPEGCKTRGKHRE